LVNGISEIAVGVVVDVGPEVRDGSGAVTAGGGGHDGRAGVSRAPIEDPPTKGATATAALRADAIATEGAAGEHHRGGVVDTFAGGAQESLRKEVALLS